eukprot:scaffold19823_cov65-Skeletonema_menzelii.AAC.1
MQRSHSSHAPAESDVVVGKRIPRLYLRRRMRILGTRLFQIEFHHLRSFLRAVRKKMPASASWFQSGRVVYSKKYSSFSSSLLLCVLSRSRVAN